MMLVSYNFLGAGCFITVRNVWDGMGYPLYFVVTFESRRIRTGVLGEPGKTSPNLERERERERLHVVI